jgi:CRP-like cAMP-binding protein
MSTMIERKLTEQKVFINRINGYEKFAVTKRTQMAKMLQEETRIRGGYLFIEGEPTDKVYYVNRGKFLVTKKLVHVGGKEQVKAVS